MVDGNAGTDSPAECGSMHRYNNLYVKYFSARRDDESLADIFRVRHMSSLCRRRSLSGLRLRRPGGGGPSASLKTSVGKLHL
jgi:hypothetical protein